MKSSRTCFFVYGYPPDFSGATSQAIKIGKVLRNQDAPPLFVSYTFNEDYLGIPCHEDFELIRFLRPLGAGLIVYHFRLLVAIVRNRGKFNNLYVNGNDGQFWTPLYLILFSRIFRKKCIMELNMEFSDPLRIRGTRFAAIKKAVASRTHAYIALSSAIEKRMRVLYPEFHLVKLYNGVDIMRFKPAQDQDEKKAVRKKLGLPEGARIVVTCGGISKRKGIDFLLDAWSHVVEREKNILFVVLGPSGKVEEGHSNAFVEETLKRSKGPEFEGNLIFRGMVPNVDEFFMAADVFAFAGRQEGSPNVLREAMACGLPVVSLELKGITSDMISDGENGYIVRVPDQERMNDWINRDISMPELVRAFSDKIRFVVNNPSVADNISRAAVKTVQSRFTIETQVERLKALFDEVA